ncbi:hypothetical protein ACLOJK_017038 [Asimina triloba]
MKLRRRMKLRMMGLHTSSHALSSIARESVDDGACGCDHLRRICRVKKSGKGSCAERQRLKPFAEDFVEGGERRREREEGEGDGRGRRTQEGEEDGRGRRTVPAEKEAHYHVNCGEKAIVNGTVLYGDGDGKAMKLKTSLKLGFTDLLEDIGADGDEDMGLCYSRKAFEVRDFVW